MTEPTVMVKRGGSYLRVAKSSVDRYVSKGYDVVDANGNTILKSVPNDITVLKKAFVDNTNEIKRLKLRIQELEGQKSGDEANKVDKPTKQRKTNKKNQ